MDKKPTIGHMTCPDCDFPDAEIKLDKNGCAYRFCPDCNLQTFTRKPEKSKRMIAKMRPVAPVTVTDTSEGGEAGKPAGRADTVPPAERPAPPVTAKPAPQPAAKKQSFDMGGL